MGLKSQNLKKGSCVLYTKGLRWHKINKKINENFTKWYKINKMGLT